MKVVSTITNANLQVYQSENNRLTIDFQLIILSSESLPKPEAMKLHSLIIKLHSTTD